MKFISLLDKPYGLYCVSISAKLGANAILGVSLAICKAGAVHKVSKEHLSLLSIPFFFGKDKR